MAPGITSMFKEVRRGEEIVCSQESKNIPRISQQVEAYNSLARIVLCGHPNFKEGWRNSYIIFTVSKMRAHNNWE